MAEETKFLFCEGKWSTFMFWPIAEPASCASSVIFLVAAWKGGVREYIDDTTRLLYAMVSAFNVQETAVYLSLIVHHRVPVLLYGVIT